MIRKKETMFQPNYAVPPGETLKETLNSVGMTQAELAERTGRPKKTVNEIITGKAAITSETALQLERVFGISASFWNNLERNYREVLARLQEEEKLQGQVEWLKQFPMRELTKRGWVRKAEDTLEQLKALLTFFGVAGIEQWKVIWEEPDAAYRDSQAYKTKPAALACWLRRGEIEASKIITKPFAPAAFRASLKQIRSLTNEGPEVFEILMTKYCAEAGVAVTFVPELPGTHIYGASRWLKSNKALIQLSLRGKSDDHFWFTFFHEAGHILLHEKQETYINEKVTSCTTLIMPDKENEANCFAEDFLMHRNTYKHFLNQKIFSENAIQEFAKSVGIAPGVVVGRLQHDGYLPYSKANGLKRRFELAES